MTYFIVLDNGNILQITNGMLWARWNNWQELFWILTSPSVQIEESFKIRAYGSNRM